MYKPASGFRRVRRGSGTPWVRPGLMRLYGKKSITRTYVLLMDFLVHTLYLTKNQKKSQAL